MQAVAAGLSAAGGPYAIVGGNAINYWVATKNQYATVTTRDVDILARREDLDRICAVMADLKFDRADLRKLVMFVSPDEPDRRSGVHMLWANELVRPSYLAPSPDPDESIVTADGRRVVSLAAIVRMKLTSLRSKDRVHLELLLSVGLIGSQIRESLPPPLAERLAEIEQEMDEDDFA